MTSLLPADPTPSAHPAPAPMELDFEAGYARLQAIADRLSDAAVPVSEMCDLFAEGKGLEIALTEFLDTERARVEAIERGEGIRRFRISRGTPAPTPTPTGAQTTPAASVAPPEIDEIPF